MTSSQQREAIEHLTQVVSSSMGLREQLDVIRIVNPQAVVSSTDTEFEIGMRFVLFYVVQDVIVKGLSRVCIVYIPIVLFSDLELLNCEKLERIREYVKQHGVQTGKWICIHSQISFMADQCSCYRSPFFLG